MGASPTLACCSLPVDGLFAAQMTLSPNLATSGTIEDPLSCIMIRIHKVPRCLCCFGAAECEMRAVAQAGDIADRSLAWSRDPSYLFSLPSRPPPANINGQIKISRLNLSGLLSTAPVHTTPALWTGESSAFCQ